MPISLQHSRVTGVALALLVVAAACSPSGPTGSSPTEAASATTAEVAPTPEVTPPVESVDPLQPLSAFVRAGDLALWRDRAENGPFRTLGDVSPNSPGEWDRIVERAADFAADPAGSRWRGPVANNPGGSVQQDLTTDSDPPVETYSLITAAAFHSLVVDDAAERRQVADELLATAREPDLQFADRSRWTPAVMDDVNPLFMISSWSSSLLLAMDYLEAGDPQIFTDAEQTELLRWFHALAVLNWLENDTIFGEEVFGDWAHRDEPPYQPIGEYLNEEKLRLAHDDVGHTIGLLSRAHNNRRAQMVRHAGMVGLRLQDATDFTPSPGITEYDGEALVAGATKFFISLLAYGVFPDGYTAELARGSQGASSAWSYTWAQLAPFATFAHLASIRGDDRLFRHQSRFGHDTTALDQDDPPKSFHRTVRVMAGFTQSYDRTYRWEGEPIDGQNIKGSEGYMDLGTLAISLLHHEDPDVRNVMLRSTDTGMTGFKSSRFTSYRNATSPFNHDWHIFPGSLFYFG